MNVKKCFQKRCPLCRVDDKTNKFYCPRAIDGHVIPVPVEEIRDFECISKRGLVNQSKKKGGVK